MALSTLPALRFRRAPGGALAPRLARLPGRLGNARRDVAA
jgi:hypothetical protein